MAMVKHCVSSARDTELESGEGWSLVKMEDHHLTKVIKIQRESFDPEYQELRESYVRRMEIFPEGNVIVFMPDPKAVLPATPPSPSEPAALKRRKVKTSSGLKMAGYILAQPFRRGQFNDVNDVADFAKWIKERSQVPRDEQDCIYIHEIAMASCSRGKGLTRPLVEYTETIARKGGFKWLSLVSLGPAFGFWQKNGYTMVQELDYGGHICYYMEKRVPYPVTSPSSLPPPVLL